MLEGARQVVQEPTRGSTPGVLQTNPRGSLEDPRRRG
jgi:hypothetical protein